MIANDHSLTLSISIIVPTYHEEAHIQGFLDGLVRSLKPLQSCEVVIVDSSTDETKANVLEYLQSTKLANFRVVSSAKGRALQMNAGAELALTLNPSRDNHYLLFLHADSVLPGDLLPWVKQLANETPQWGFFPVKLSARGLLYRLIEFGMNTRSQATSVATGDQGIFVSSRMWIDVGGYNSIELMEDVELTKRLRKLAKPYVSREAIHVSCRRWQSKGVLKTVFLMWALRLAYVVGVSPKSLAKWYRSKAR